MSRPTKEQLEAEDAAQDYEIQRKYRNRFDMALAVVSSTAKDLDVIEIGRDHVSSSETLRAFARGVCRIVDAVVDELEMGR